MQQMQLNEQQPPLLLEGTPVSSMLEDNKENTLEVIATAEKLGDRLHADAWAREQGAHKLSLDISERANSEC